MGPLICPACSTENPQGADFCLAGGTSLARRCPSCGAETLAGARFCVDCGAALTDSAPASQPAAAPRAAPLPEERRQVAVLFADLSGYTAVAETMDPEALHGLVDRCLRRLGQEVERFGVTVGERTYRTTCEAFEYTELEPLVLKGKSEPVPAWEAVCPVAQQPVRRPVPMRPPAPLIGRDFEIELLDSLFERVVREQQPHL